ncbi:MAG TPA: hypothetical protein VGP96_16805 [Candidatus Dormibacteraeota bacterium]|nr:hypothetical protein [Candidatus Dormibacteraeota bacterium]
MVLSLAPSPFATRAMWGRASALRASAPAAAVARPRRVCATCTQ